MDSRRFDQGRVCTVEWRELSSWHQDTTQGKKHNKARCDALRGGRERSIVYPPVLVEKILRFGPRMHQIA